MLMTRYLQISIIILVLSLQGRSQNNKLHQIGVNYATFGNSHSLKNNNLDLKFYSIKSEDIGINYIYNLEKNIDVDINLIHSKRQFYTNKTIVQGIGFIAEHNIDFSLLKISSAARYHFLDFLFINSGISMYINTGGHLLVDNYFGYALTFGCGIQSKINHRLSIYINPLTEYFNIFSLSKNKITIGYKDSILKFGILYRL